MAYRHISQREARETRREVEHLRAFVNHLRFGGSTSIPIATITLADFAKGKLAGVRAVEFGAVMVAITNGDSFELRLVVPPKERVA